MRLPGTRDALLGGLASVALIAAPAWAKAPPVAPQNGPQSDFPMVVGQPYQIGGVTFVPSDSMNFDSVGYASVSTESSGISAAHHTLPVPSYAEVTDIATGRTILVRIDRRGPMDGSHAIELSPGAALQLGLAANGRAAVRVRRVNPPEAERALLRAGQPAPERMATPKPLLDVLRRKLNPALAQRTLDSADDDPAPAKTPATPKPAVITRGPPPKAPKPAATQTTIPGAPPKGYIPSVPAPVDKPAARTPATGASFAAEAPVEHGEPKADIAKRPQPAIKPKPAPAPEPAARDAVRPDGGFAIQAGAFADRTRAQAVAGKIGGQISKAGKAWRVRVGPYATHASAEAALANVKSAGYSDARILRAD